MKTPAERGAIGAWAYRARQDAELSVEEVADRLRLRGMATSTATIRAWEGGSKKPGRAKLNALSEIYGLHPPVEELSVKDELTAALNQNTAVMAALLEFLKGSSASRAISPADPEVQREVAAAVETRRIRAERGQPHRLPAPPGQPEEP